MAAVRGYTPEERRAARIASAIAGKQRTGYVPDPEDKRRWQLKSRYGITPGFWNGVIAALQGRCMLCGVYKGEKLVPDHDHNTGKFRGALCSGCNVGLGRFGDDPSRLRSAAAYVERVPTGSDLVWL